MKEQPQATGGVFRFGVFELDREARELRKRGARLRLRGQPFEVLTALLERPGEIVSREELQARLWRQDTFVEFDRGLNTAVQKIRQALSDSAETPRYLETIPRHGYRFIFPVERPNQPPQDQASIPPQRTRAAWFVSGVIALAAAGLLAWKFSGEQSPAPRMYTIEPKGLEGVQTLAGTNRPVISPDGRYIVYHGGRSLWLYDAGSGEDKPLVETSGELSWCAWSPDSRWISYAKIFELFKSAVDGGAPVKVADIGRGAFGGSAWRPDGSEIVFSVSNRLHRVPSEGGTPQPLRGPEDQEVAGSYPHFLPTGALLFVGESEGQPSLLALEAGGGKIREVLPGHDNWVFASPGGRLVLASGVRHNTVAFSDRALEVRGKPATIAERWERNGHFASVSRDGVLVYEDYTWPVGQLVWRDRGGRKLEAVGEARPGLARPHLSPDGRRILVTAREGVNPGAAPNLWAIDIENRTAARLTSDGGSEGVWSPDSRTVTYRGPNGRLLQVRVGEDPRPQPLGDLERTGYPYEWTADGGSLLATGWSPGTEGQIWSVDIARDGAAGEPVMIVDNRFDTTAPDLSPDGRFLAYQSDETGRPEIYVQRYPGGEDKTRVSDNGGAQPRWRADGGEIYYVERADALIASRIELGEHIRVGTRTELFREPTLNARGQNYDVAPDGSRFLVVETTERGTSGIRVVQSWLGLPLGPHP